MAGWATAYETARLPTAYISEFNFVGSGASSLQYSYSIPSPEAAHPELGFWEVETSSLRDFPQQFRMFQIMRNSDNNIAVINDRR